LDREFLVVAINGLLLINREGSSGLAGGAASQTNIIDVVDKEGSFCESAFDAFIYNFFKLTEDFTPYCHYSLNYIITILLLISLPRCTCLKSRI
jgi:hypothetical protein